MSAAQPAGAVAGLDKNIISMTDRVSESFSEPASLTNSQASLDESIASRASEPQRISVNSSESSADAPASHRHSLGSDKPPSSSQSSSVNIINGGSPKVAQALVASEQRSTPKLPALTVHEISSKGAQNNFYHGQKRTASGHIKSTDSSLATSPQDLIRDNFKQPGSISSASPISDLSAQLKTRLSYAMMKVQNGWQTRTIDEVENLAAQYIMPTSTASSPKQAFAFPQIHVPEKHPERGGFAESLIRTTAPLEPSLYALHKNGVVRQDHAYPQQSHSSYSPPKYQGDLAFQESGRSRSGSRPGTAQSPTAHVPSLAPPLDFGARNPRRSGPLHNRTPASLDVTRNSSNLSNSSTSSAKSIVPSTPPPQRSPAIKSTSQKATAMEKDAIETLLFMSSPGNSQYRPPSSHLPGSPLRNQFSPDQNRSVVSNDDNAPGIPPRPRNILDSATLNTDESIDRLLDQMPDGESSSDDDVHALSGQKLPAFV